MTKVKRSKSERGEKTKKCQIENRKMKKNKNRTDWIDIEQKGEAGRIA